MKKYLKLWFWLDLLSTIPYDRVVEALAGSNSSETTNVIVKSAALIK
jgi:hypothetical protein